MAQDPYIGRQILGQYHIEKKIGEGGMGLVYLADQPSMSRTAAIKILRPEIANEEQIERFQREGQALANMDHPNIVKVYNAGTLDDGALYMAMEFVSGRDMEEELNQNGRMEWRRALKIVMQATDALVEAHTHGIVHRDLKPENVLLMEWRDNPDHVKVMDFGIAKVLDNAQELESSATVAGVIHGTPMYMSPEQARGDKVDHRSDIYSLGIVLYAMLTGELPIKSNTLVGYIIAHQQDPPAPLTSLVEGVPKALEQIIMKMLEKKPDDRHQTMQELLEEFRILAAPPAPKRTAMKVGLALGGVALVCALGVIGFLATRTPKAVTKGLAPGIVEASDNKAPKWSTRSLASIGTKKSTFVGLGVAETKSAAKDAANVDALFRLYEQVGNFVSVESKNAALKALINASKGKTAKAKLKAEAVKAWPKVKFGESEASYWEKRRPTGGGASQYHYKVLYSHPTKKLQKVTKSVLQAKTAFGIKVKPFLPTFARATGVPGGVVVDTVKRRGVAESSGLKAADVITRVSGKKARSISIFAKLMKKAGRAQKKTGAPILVDIIRLEGKKVKALSIELIK